MSKPGRLSIRSAIEADEGPIDATRAEQHPAGGYAVKTVSGDTVKTVDSSGGKTLKRPPHLSVYVEARVNKALKEIALMHDCKVHDLVLEGLDYILKKHGRSLQELNQKS